MQWQDLVLTFCQVIFTLALLPSVFSKDKPSVYSSLLTSTFLYIFAFTYATMSLWFSSIGAISTATVWLILAVQKLRMNK